MVDTVTESRSFEMPGIYHTKVLGVRLSLVRSLVGASIIHCLAAKPAYAQADVGPTVAPRLLEAPALRLECPPDERIEHEVELTLQVSATGEVEAVLESATEDLFVRSASRAAKRMRFEPARANGEAVASRIRYRFLFRVPCEPAAKPEAGEREAKSRVTPTQAEREGEGARSETSADRGSAIAAKGQLRHDVTLQGGPSSEPPAVPSPTGAVRSRARSAGPATSTIEVRAVGTQTAKARIENSANAAAVLSMRRIRVEGADLNRALRRSRGVRLQQSAGLGSFYRISIGGLTGKQLRFFVDSLPLEWSGLGSRVTAIPAGILQRVDVHRGWVPIELGSDALGGALAFRTRKMPQGFRAVLNYETGSFGLHRLSSQLSYRGRGRWSVRAIASYDDAQNNYPMRIQVPKLDGSLVERSVRRFHDRYRGVRARLEGRWQGRRARVSAFVFAEHSDKELQSNRVMTVPFGEASYERGGYGGVLRTGYYAGKNLDMSLDLGAAYAPMRFLDKASCRYDWYGRCVRESGLLGESGARPFDRRVDQIQGFTRYILTYAPSSNHTLRLALHGVALRREGEDRALEGGRDLLSIPQNLLSLNSGLSYSLLSWSSRLRTSLFGKFFGQILKAKQFGIDGGKVDQSQSQNRLGGGAALSVKPLSWLRAKASYEWATRMPSGDEIFGNAALILPNLQLKSESSHNLNLGLHAGWSGAWGSIVSDAHLFLRYADDLILLLGAEHDLKYRNLLTARIWGAELLLAWQGLGDHLEIQVKGNHENPENRSRDGDFAPFLGDRIPNRPLTWGQVRTSLSFRSLWSLADQLRFNFGVRHVQPFFRAWESLGLASTKQKIPPQNVLFAGLGYQLRANQKLFALHIRAENLGDSRVFDFFGVPKPGRAFYSALTIEL